MCHGSWKRFRVSIARALGAHSMMSARTILIIALVLRGLDDSSSRYHDVFTIGELRDSIRQRQITPGGTCCRENDILGRYYSSRMKHRRESVVYIVLRGLERSHVSVLNASLHFSYFFFFFRSGGRLYGLERARRSKDTNTRTHTQKHRRSGKLHGGIIIRGF